MQQTKCWRGQLEYLNAGKQSFPFLETKGRGIFPNQILCGPMARVVLCNVARGGIIGVANNLKWML